jgi:hypothetical protein
VTEVLGSEEEDVFHGIEVGGIAGHSVLIPAVNVASITNKQITTDLSAESIRALPAFQPEHSYQLGFVGFIRRHLGWVEEGRNAP